MTTINQINNLILSGHNQQGLSVCQDHEKAILAEIGSTVNGLIASNEKFKNIFDSATQGITTPYTIHFSENEITINNQTTRFSNITDSQDGKAIHSQASALLDKINSIYIQCHGPDQTPTSANQPYSSMYPQQPFYPMMQMPCPYFHPHMPPQGYAPYGAPQHTQSPHFCCHSHTQTLSKKPCSSFNASATTSSCHSRNDTHLHSVNNQQDMECQTDSAQEIDSDESSSSIPKTISKQTSVNSAASSIADDDDAIHENDTTQSASTIVQTDFYEAPNLAAQVKANHIERSMQTDDEIEDVQLQVSADVMKSFLNLAVLLKDSSENSNKTKVRQNIATLFERTPRMANDLYYQMYLVGHKKQKESREVTEQMTDYETGRLLFAQDYDHVTDEDRAIALERYILSELADNLARKHTQASHAALIEVYTQMPQDIQNKIEGHMWELCGGPQGEIEFGKRMMHITNNELARSYQADAIRRHLDKELTISQ